MSARRADVATPKPTRTALPWPRLAVIALFGLFYAYDLFEAISNIFGVTAQLAEYNTAAAAVGLNVIPVPWTLLVANVALPVITMGVALLLGRRSGLAIAAFLLLAGLAVSATLTLSVTAFA